MQALASSLLCRYSKIAKKVGLSLLLIDERKRIAAEYLQGERIDYKEGSRKNHGAPHKRLVHGKSEV
jgi:hypothetical protein